MGMENILNNELASINRGIIKARVPLIKLLENPELLSGGKKIHINKKCLETIAENCNLPTTDIYLPITFFVPAGIDEGYIMSETDARVIEALNIKVRARNSRFWVKKYDITNLVVKFPNCFQRVLVP